MMTPELETELQEVVDSLYITKYNNFYCSNFERVQSSWRADHDIVPDVVSNIYSLKNRIIETAKDVLDFDGNIELDQGYSYAYSISTMFPAYFQKQVIKAQFSLYDALSHNDQDVNAKQKNILTNIMQVDSNIFKDIYTVKNDCPSDEGLKMEVKTNDIKVFRLKSCGYWIDYVCLTPTQSDWDKKQESIINHNNQIDSLLANGMNMLDTNDLATINKINEDMAILHQNTVRRVFEKNPHDFIT
jgi:hypothetical protein